MRNLCKLLVVLGVMLALLFSVACGDDEADSGEMEKDGEPKPVVVETAKTSRLETVKERGHVICASRNDVPGYGSIDEAGNSVGFDIDLCRAVAAAVLNDPDAFEIPLDYGCRARTYRPVGRGGLARTHRHVDDLARCCMGNYAQTMFYDGQGFMVPKSLGVSSALELLAPRSV